MLEIRCPACNKLFLYASSHSEGEVEVKCTRSGRQSSCGWTGIYHLSSAPTPISTSVTSSYGGAPSQS